MSQEKSEFDLQGKRIAKKDDDNLLWGGAWEEEPLPFSTGCTKGEVLQQKRVFGETPVKVYECVSLLTKVMWLLVQGEAFTPTEAEDLFFAVTKLFQAKDVALRRLVYLTLKELTPLAKSSLIITASLTKDMTSVVPNYRANSLRVLCGVLEDVSLLGQGSRLIKQAIVDQEPYVASAALLSGYHLLAVPANASIVSQWTAEVQEAFSSSDVMVQYHALGVLSRLRSSDRLALSKLVTSATRAPLRSPWAHCLLIRLVNKVIREDTQGSHVGVLYEYLEGCLRHKSDLVIFEAARAISELPGVTSRELTPAVSVLQLFLSSPKAVVRFAAVRTLNRVAQTHPTSVTLCNLDLDALVGDSNRSIATLAITTLLKTGSEESVDRLLKQISSFLGDISEDFRTVVVEALQALCLKFPSKQSVLMAFLDTLLRSEGGEAFKSSIVEALITIIQEQPNALEKGLGMLSEFIEDCEHPQLSVRVLHFLGDKAGTAPTPGNYIRYIYNRLILENAAVRSAAASALLKFAMALPALAPSISTLLGRCVGDDDDEVRDRCTMYLGLLTSDAISPEQTADVLHPRIRVPLENLEHTLQEYVASPSDAPFDMSTVPAQNAQQAAQQAKAAEVASRAGRSAESIYGEQLAMIPALADLGALWRSTGPFVLTEADTEYSVSAMKHVFERHVVLQFNVGTTMKDQHLLNVRVRCEPQGTIALSAGDVLTAERVTEKLPGVCYTVYKRTGPQLALGRLHNMLKFNAQDVEADAEPDPDDEGFEDEYELESLELETKDYVRPTYVPNFTESWEQLGAEAEAKRIINLAKATNVVEAVDQLTSFFGLAACDNSERASAKKTKHALYLSGVFLGGVPVLVRARIRKSQNVGCDVEIAVRSGNAQVSQQVISSVAE